jgi:hypothetical protein
METQPCVGDAGGRRGLLVAQCPFALHAANAARFTAAIVMFMQSSVRALCAIRVATVCANGVLRVARFLGATPMAIPCCVDVVG